MTDQAAGGPPEVSIRAPAPAQPGAADQDGGAHPDPDPDRDFEPEPAAADPAAAASRKRGWTRQRLAEGWAFLELFAVCGFVVVQPVLEVVGQSPDFFIFHGVGPAGIVALVVIFALVPPAVLWGLGVLSRLVGSRIRWTVHVATLGALFVLFMIQLGKHVTDLRGVLLVALAVLAAVLAVLGYLRFAATGHLLRFAAVGPLVFVLLFTFASPASAVMFPGGRPGGGAEPQVIGANPPIVMIVLDEFAMLSLLDGDGSIDGERFPNFARLADDSTWWRNATSVAGWTPYALPAMLTGRMPAEHVAPHYAVYPDNLFTLLGDVYDVSARESIAHLCPPWHCGDRVDQAQGGLPAALAESATLLGELVSPTDPVSDPKDDFAEPTVAEQIGAAAAARDDRPEFLFRQALAASQPARFHEFMSGLAQASPGEGRPDLHFLHLLMPHTPWTYLPDGMRYEPVLRGLPEDGPWWSRLALQRYLLQLEYTDALLGGTLDLLQETGQYDDALVVLTSDHGVALTPGPPGGEWIAGSRELGPDNLGAEELLWVPLFIKEPGQTEPRVDERNWQHVDLLPTLADYAGVAVPWEVDGISWLREERTGTGKSFVSALGDDKDIREVDGPARYRRIMEDPQGFPPVPPAPLPELVGTEVAEHPVVDGDATATLAEEGAFTGVDPASGTVPALVHGTVSREVPENTPLAIAVNGRVGAVVPVVAGAEDPRRFAGLVQDASLFQPGENSVELFLVPDGTTLQRLTR